MASALLQRSLCPSVASFAAGKSSFNGEGRSLLSPALPALPDLRRRRNSALGVRPAEKPAGVKVNAFLKALDDSKEESLTRRRTFYTHDLWRRHRSTWRHFRHIFQASDILRLIAPAVVTMTLIAAGVAKFNTMVLAGQAPSWAKVLSIPALPFSLTAPVLSLLLVFRTNASYSRFDEARKQWGSVLNRTRDLARQAVSYMSKSEDAKSQQEFLRHLAAYPVVLKHHLVPEGSLEEDLRPILQPAEVSAVLASPHKPSYVIQLLSTILASSHVSELQRTLIDPSLTLFYDLLGGMERLLRTPLPTPYTRLTSRFLVLWHVFLPMALWEPCKWLVVPVQLFTAAAFFYIEEVGVDIEEPFNVLALGAICQRAKESVEQAASDGRNMFLKWPMPQDNGSSNARAKIINPQAA